MVNFFLMNIVLPVLDDFYAVPAWMSYPSCSMFLKVI